MKSWKGLICSFIVCAFLGLLRVIPTSSTEYPEKDTFTIRVRLTAAHGKEPADIPVVPVEFDANIPLIITIERVIQGHTPWVEGSRVTLRVHSLALMFGEREFNDEPFLFTFESAGKHAWRLKSCNNIEHENDHEMPVNEPWNGCWK